MKRSHLLTPSSRSKFIAATALGLSVLLVSACGSDADSRSADSGFSAAGGATPVAGRPTPVENTDDKPIKIAIVAIAPEFAEFFKAYEAGIARANEVLKSSNATVEYIPVTTISADAFNNTLRSTITQGYDAIATQVLSSANCAPLEEAVAKGIPVAVINSTASCVESTGALFFHGEDARTAWGDQMATALLDAVGDQECTVGILTAGFAIEAMEERRMGVLDGLEGTNITPVDKGVDVGVDPGKTQAAARDYVSANEDLCGLVVLFGDNGAAAAALTDEQVKRVKVVSGDLTEGSVQQLKAGKQAAAFTQDPFGQTYDTALWLYNAVVTGDGPEGGFFQPSKGVIVTADNVDDAVEAQSKGE